MLQLISRALVLLVLTLIPVSVQAAGSEQVSSFVSNVALDGSNTATVTETISYDFGTNVRHGIFRKIPVRQRLDGGNQYRYDLEPQAVTMDGSQIEYDTSREGDYKVLKIGDPDATISGLHVYRIVYTLKPVVTLNGDKSLFAFNVTGNEWDVPIAFAKVTVTLPEGVTPIEGHCYVGPTGSRQETGCDLGGTTAQVAQTLLPGSGMTVVFDMPATAVSGYLEARPPTIGERLEELLPVVIALLITGVVLLVFASLFVRWLIARRRRKRKVVIAQYEAPDGLLPGEIGYLLDDAGDMKEITATLLHAAVRGYIAIKQTRAKSFWRGSKYELSQLKSFDGLQDFERTLLDAIFTGKQTIDMGDVSRTGVASAISVVQARFKERLSSLGYYGSGKTTKRLWRRMLEHGVLTSQGADEWAKVAGFKLYLSVVEKDRLKFTDAPERTPERFSALLPYAVALGVEKEWAKQFEGIDVSPAMGWYSGNNFAHGYVAASLVNDFSGDFGKTVASSFTPPSSSSGGFSGGGAGGGGGGSW